MKRRKGTMTPRSYPMQFKSIRKCPECGCIELIVDTKGAQMVCNNCGFVITPKSKMQKRSPPRAYEKVLQLLEKKSVITLEKCQEELPEISSGTFHSVMNTLCERSLVEKVPLPRGRRRISYQKTGNYSIEKGREVIKTHYRETRKKYQTKATVSKRFQRTRTRQ